MGRRLLTNAVNVFVDTAVVNGGQVVVDNVHDILDVKTASRDGGGNQNWRLCSLKGTAKLDISITICKKKHRILTWHLHVRAGYGPSGWKY